ncbi:MAG: hypothetical protein ACRENI_11950 [Gemmatimonadaceae bacterium]
MTRSLLVPLVLAGLACVRRPTVQYAESDAAGGLAAALTAAWEAALAGDYASGDTILVAFARTNAGSGEAAEALYWRAIYQLDPGNPDGSARLAVVILDEYIAGGTALTRRAEAGTLRRTAALVDSLERTERVVVTTANGETQVVARDREIERLREELKKTTGELERIKRRLSSPNP